jgi:hypothetical protein
LLYAGAMKRIALAAAIAALAAALPRAARADEGWRQKDWVYGSLSAAAGGTGLGALGALGGSLLDPPCTPSATTTCTPAFTLAGAGAGLIIGSAYGVTLYGRKRGLGGSLKSAVIGSLIGNVASGSAMVLVVRAIDSETIGLPIAFGVLIGFPAVGATIGYRRSVDEGVPAPVGPPPPAPVALALVGHSPEAGLSLQVPAVTVAALGDDVAVYVPLAAGRF